MTEQQYPRSPKELVGGMAHLGRFIDKIRLRHAGKIPDYNYITTGFDKALIEFLQIDPQALEQRVLSGGSDEDVLNWITAHGRAPSAAEARLWTKNVLSAKPDDDGARGRFQERLNEVAGKRGVSVAELPAVSTWVDVIELDEGRL